MDLEDLIGDYESKKICKNKRKQHAEGIKSSNLFMESLNESDSFKFSASHHSSSSNMGYGSTNVMQKRAGAIFQIPFQKKRQMKSIDPEQNFPEIDQSLEKRARKYELQGDKVQVTYKNHHRKHNGPARGGSAWQKKLPERATSGLQQQFDEQPAVAVPRKIFLEDQRSSLLKEFPCVCDEEVFEQLYTNPNFFTVNRSMLKQNIEADFDTDVEQIARANEMMRNELIESISYCVTQDPYTLVNNIRYQENRTVNIVLPEQLKSHKTR